MEQRRVISHDDNCSAQAQQIEQIINQKITNYGYGRSSFGGNQYQDQNNVEDQRG
jgi:hypothetical protein